VAPNASVVFVSALANTSPTTYSFATTTVTINRTGFYRIDYTITGADNGAARGLAYAIFNGATQVPGVNKHFVSS
jgi:hypothetical protein